MPCSTVVWGWTAEAHNCMPHTKWLPSPRLAPQPHLVQRGELEDDLHRPKHLVPATGLALHSSTGRQLSESLSGALTAGTAEAGCHHSGRGRATTQTVQRLAPTAQTVQRLSPHRAMAMSSFTS